MTMMGVVITKHKCIKIIQAAKNLVDQLDVIHNDPSYASVWGFYATHGFTYGGPTYDKELEELEKLLKENDNVDD